MARLEIKAYAVLWIFLAARNANELIVQGISVL